MPDQYPPENGERISAPEAARQAPKKHSLKLWVGVIVFVALAAGAYFLLRRETPTAQRTASSQSLGAGGRFATAIPVVAAKAQKGNIPVYINGLGAVTPIYTVTVKSRVDGQLMKVYYREGDDVSQGAPLVEIDPRPYQVQLMQAQAQMAKDQAALDNAQLDLTRYQTLITHNAIPEQTLATQKATVEQDEAAIKTDQAAIASAQLNITYCHITAPISGRIGLRLVDPGNFVQASSQSALLVITQMQPISVIFTIAEDQVPAVLQKIRSGDRLEVEALSRDMTTKLGTGTLTTLDNEIDPSTGTLKLRATFANSSRTLFPNQFVNARLLVDEKRGVTIVPSAVIQRNAQSTYVYLVKPDSTVTVRPVTTGVTEGGETEIVSGLSPGDEAVMTGVDKLQEGSKVSVHLYGESRAKGN